ncbi:MAG: FAD-dependent thymidylate synthase [Candidatus Marinimicrobia bacterium]|nr:FAD-dependent thymidylate synthase [Candidatus Neomarinimicrobiota bacterium]MCF7921695.1 FAD-dependent thymidylate synthase [Candidatus Neomarinimicrobiota bacterium]
MGQDSKQFEAYDVLGDGISFVRLINSMGSDVEIVNGARVSFGKRRETLDEKDKVLIQYLADERHTSPFEHVAFTFHVKCPLFVTRQWHRHRTWSYNEISRRYTSMNMEFYVPKAYRQQAETNRQASTDDLIESTKDGKNIHDLVSAHTESAFKFYEALIEQGVAREQARMVLPQNMYTEMYATVNLHNLIHFVELRIHAGAQWEIQQYALKLLDLAEAAAPYAIKAIRKARNW